SIACSQMGNLQRMPLIRREFPRLCRGLAAPFDRLFPLRQKVMTVAKMELPLRHLVFVRTKAKRGFNIGDPVPAAAEIHFIKAGVSVCPSVIAIVRDRRLGLRER